MRTLLRLGCGAVLLALPVALHAQTCDFMVTNGSWSQHSRPDSIYVNFIPDVVTTSPQTLQQYDMNVIVRFNSVIIDQHLLHLRWSHGIGCTAGCPPNICEEKEWTYKGKVFRDNSKCTLNAQSVCGCPPLGDPVMHRKPVPKPVGSGTIEIELVPLNLVGCSPINPGNDRVQFPFPGGGPNPIVPAVLPAGVILLLLGLALLGFVMMKRRPLAG